jgi:DNA-binding XRE family transcriptional regulator
VSRFTEGLGMTVQIVEIAGQKMAMLPVADYERLLDLAEDRVDVAAAVQAEERRRKGEEYLPAALVDEILDGGSALRAWRKHRGLSQVELAAATGTYHSQLSDIEKGKRQGKPALWRALAKALNVSVDDILPED